MHRALPRALACAALAMLCIAQAPPSRDQLQEAERAAAASRAAAAEAARRAAEAAAEERALAEQRVAAARRLQRLESEVDAARDRALAADRASHAAAGEAERRAAQLAPMIPVMRRLALWPAETLLVVPAEPEEVLRGVLVLQGLVRTLRHEAEALRAATAESGTRARMAREEAARLAEAVAEARAAAMALDAEITAARARQAEALDAEREAARRAQHEAARAQDLSEMLARLAREEAREREQAASRARAEAEAQARAERERRREEARAGRRPPSPEPSPPVQAALPPPPPPPPGGRALPVAGRVARGFGDPGEAGPARGITFSAPPGARVVSPCGGRAVFSEPFRSYGLLLIVDCGEGHHFVLAGLERLDTAAGSRVLAGEPVGVLGPGEGEPRRSSLYVELRRNGQPVDPRPWFTVRG
ncbi:MAG TPA: peptidoglycan DD-metalloendopeptidase family protein [Acetobacteraceae bacterium]|nr:peptidoglycan DD-metalloendopeptidase family protein [Acetobacteraceae bacterium]